MDIGLLLDPAAATNPVNHAPHGCGVCNVTINACFDGRQALQIMLRNPAQDFLLNGTPNPRLKVKRIDRIKMLSHAGAFDQRAHCEIFPADTLAGAVNAEQRRSAAMRDDDWPFGAKPIGKRTATRIAVFIVLDEFKDYRVRVDHDTPVCAVFCGDDWPTSQTVKQGANSHKGSFRENTVGGCMRLLAG
jgi:hypothetical protein